MGTPNLSCWFIKIRRTSLLASVQALIYARAGSHYEQPRPLNKNTLSYLYCFCVAFLLSVTAIVLDILALSWPAFTAFVLSVLLTGFACLRLLNIKPPEIDCYFVVLAALAGLSHFMLIDIYPYVSTGDEMRDSGLHSQQIAVGIVRNLFGWGLNNGFGLIVPTFGSFFYRFFGPSVLTFRVFAAVLSVLDVLLLYVVARALLKEKRCAALAALTLCFLPLHLFIGRTQPVVILSSLWATVMVACVYCFFTRTSWSRYLLLGLSSGVGFTFQAAIRAPIMILGGCCFLKGMSERRARFALRALFWSLGLFAIGFVIGIGPTVNSSSLEILFQTSKIRMLDDSPSTSLLALWERYIEAFSCYFLRSPSFQYPHPEAILSPGLAFLALLGFLRALYRARVEQIWIAILLVLFILPLSNGALTDNPHVDHRLMPSLPLLSLLVGLGLQGLIAVLPGVVKKISPLLSACLFALLLWQGITFFSENKANDGRSHMDHLSMHLIYWLTQSGIGGDSVCVRFNDTDAAYFERMHVEDQMKYFLPSTKMSFVVDPTLATNQIAVARSCEPGKPLENKTVVCVEPNWPRCSNKPGAIQISFSSELLSPTK